MVQCMTNRDSIVYYFDILRQHAEKALDIIADTVLNPTLSDEEIEDIKAIIQFQNSEMPAEVLSREAAQMAAYTSYPLGNYHNCPLDKVDGINRTKVNDFRVKHLFGSNCILSAVGIDHETFVKLANQKFSQLSSGGILEPRIPSRFVGGLVKNVRELKEPFVKVALAFEVGNGWEDPDLIPMCVLQMLLGGGSSFSAGGPGKGITLRLLPSFICVKLLVLIIINIYRTELKCTLITS